MKELFYSNGIDIFGPVDIEEFSKNRYYKSTLIWYEGLSGWINIADCQELKHLIGTMSTPSIDTGLQHSLPNATPPLTQQKQDKVNGIKRYLVIASALVLLLVLLTVYYFNTKSMDAATTEPSNGMVMSTPNDSTPMDTAKLRQAKAETAIALNAEIKTYRLNWSKFIIATTNDYSANELGGISDLKIILKNNCPFKIDHAQVQVNYLKANGTVYHTERLDFDNLDAKTSKELFAPNSDRGVTVACSILVVKSADLNLCYDKTANNFKSLTGEDPYRCLLQ